MTGSWAGYIAALASDARFGLPASPEEVTRVEKDLGIALPAELKLLLGECDGVVADYGANVVWSASELLHRNQGMRDADSLRDLYMPFGNLLFFGDDGGGDLFAFAVQGNGSIRRSDIFRWEHETDGRIWFAASLKDFLGRRLSQGG
ncbi:SMI1/KNR4 family protein [Dyella terrae]|uniref:SMI1/KNR4 family protein n=1 Tax=Dyella terrae TaxID=522259 RepID=UPI001EFD525D|nr:SMI1/KNR4 family protein [Dyella terrae]